MIRATIRAMIRAMIRVPGGPHLPAEYHNAPARR